jgi:hypothetical protein
MRPSITLLILLLALQLALAGGLFLRHDPLAAARSDTPLLPAGLVQKSDQITIESHAASPPAAAPGAGAVPGGASTRIVLQKKDATWVLPASFGVPADSAKVNALLDRLSGLKRGLPIATTESALRRFKLLDSDFERRLVLSGSGKPLGTVYFGSSPGLRKSDARTADDRAVYAVDMPTYELPTDTGAWLSPELLQVDTTHLTQLSVADGHETLQLVRQKGTEKQPESWIDPDLKGGERIDSAQAASLVQQIGSLRADAVLGTAAQPEWQQDHPVLTLHLKDDKSQDAQWTLSKPASGDFFVLKTSAHPWYFSISSAAAGELTRTSSRNTLVVTPGKSAAAAGAMPAAGSQGSPRRSGKP